MKRWLMAGALFLGGCGQPSIDEVWVLDSSPAKTITVQCNDEQEPHLEIGHNRTKGTITCVRVP